MKYSQDLFGNGQLCLEETHTPDLPLMSSRVWVGVVLAGVLGIVLTFSTLLPPLGGSLLLGSSIGLIIIGPIGGVATFPGTPKPSIPLPGAEDRLKSLVDLRERRTKAERESALDNFDRMLERMERSEGHRVVLRVSPHFGRFLDSMTAHYPQWDSEGRIRTYVLMKKVSENITPGNADSCLDLIYSTLVARGAEATEMSRLTLIGKVEEMYRDPTNQWPHHIAGTLLLMNRDDGGYAKGLVVDAIHLWSSERFDRLLPDFRVIGIMPKSARDGVEDLVQKEIGKASRAHDVPAEARAKEILETFIPVPGAQVPIRSGPA